MNLSRLLPALLLFLLPDVFAAEPTPTPAKPEEAPEIQEYDALDKAKLNRALGSRAAVVGTLTNAFWVRDRVLMLIYQEDREGFVAVSFAQHRDKLDAAFDGDIAAALNGKKIKVTGTLQTHSTRPQIVITSPDQIEVIKD